MQKNHILNIGKTIAILVIETIIGYLFNLCGLTEIHIFTVYVLGILITAMVTASKACSLLSVCGIFCFNYFFAEPLFSFNAYHIGYPITFIILLVAALLMGTLANKNAQHAKELTRTAYRNQILLETNQLLQKAKGQEDIIEVTANRLIKLVDKSVFVFIEEKGKLKEPRVFLKDDSPSLSFSISQRELEVALWTYHHNKRAGAFTEVFEFVKGTYLPICTEERIYGVIGIDMNGQSQMTMEFELVLGECALAFEREYYNRAREEAAVQAKNEKLRADLLRSISHDLRTPLTSISGNATLLAEQGERLTFEKRKMLSKTIVNDSVWLINMVENLLAITKLGEVKNNISMYPELLEEILLDVFEKVEKQHPTHKFRLEMSEEVQVVFCNAQLICQVMGNLLENAVKYTKEGTTIRIFTKEEKDTILVEVSDEGEGVSDEEKPHIFEMFYTTAGRGSDRGRGFGIGLALCKEIISAHGGEIWVTDAIPHGAVFTFSLKKARVK